VTQKRKKGSGSTIDIGLNFGGLFKGLNDLIETVSDLAEVDQAGEIKREGNIKAGDTMEGVYGFTIRTDIGGRPTVKPFGNVRRTHDGQGVEVAKAREPLVDTFDETTEFLIVAELPGVGEAEIQVTVQDDILTLETTGNRHYAKEVLLPKNVNPATIQQTYRNGILELRFEKLG